MTDSQKWMIFVGVVGGGYLVYLLSPVFTPFLLAALLAYLGDPLVDRLQAMKLSRTLAVTVVFALLFSLLTVAALLLVPLIERQVAHLIARLPDYAAWLQTSVFPWVQQRLGLEEWTLDLETLQKALREHWREAGGFAAGLAASISSSGLAVLQWLANLVLIPVVTFYLLRDWDHLVQGIHSLFPRDLAPTVSRLARESDEVLGAFLRGQFLVMLALGILYSLGLWIAGLELAVLIGMGAGLVSFVPYLGTIVGVLAAGVAMLVQTQDMFDLLAVGAVFVVGQVLEGTVLTPTLVGDRVGLHPVAVIFAVLAGGHLFGFLGVLLALPIAAVLAVLVRHAHERYTGSQFYDKANG